MGQLAHYHPLYPPDGENQKSKIASINALNTSNVKMVFACGDGCQGANRVKGKFVLSSALS
jgi:hypothetical protein